MSLSRTLWRMTGLSAALLFTLTLSLTSFAATPYDWLQFDGIPQHRGNNTAETTISASNVATLQKKTSFSATLPSYADGAPVYLNGVSTPSGTRNLLYVTTRAGHIIALDAQTGAIVWQHQNGPNGCVINNPTPNGSGTACYTTSAPAIGPSRLYVYSYGLDGYVHKYQVGDGTEYIGGGWPELTTKKPWDEKGSSQLSVATAQNGKSFLYMVHAGYPGDNGDYQGHVTAINLSDGTQNVFNTLCSARPYHFVYTQGWPSAATDPQDCKSVQSGVWARAGVVYSPATNRIYISSGNGTYDPVNHRWGDSVLALYANGTGSGPNNDPLDSYTPTDYQQLQNSDSDLGSTLPAILPVAVSSDPNLAHLAVMGGKDSRLRLINIGNLNGHGAAGIFTGGEVGSLITIPQGGVILTQPAVWVNPADNSNWVFVTNGNGSAAYRVELSGQGVPQLVLKWNNSNAGTSPLVANNVLYYAQGNLIRAVNPLTGAVLWSDTGIGGIHWATPIVVNGVLYIADTGNKITAYSLNGQ